MDLSLQGSVAFVAGSSRGIGLASAARFAAEGASVVVTGRSRGDVDEAVGNLRTEGGDVFGWSGDLATGEGIAGALRATIDRFGRLDVVVSSIGDGHGRPGWEQGPHAWTETFERNLWPSVRLCEQAVPHLDSRGGAIILVGSITGRERLGPLPYGTAKAALAAYATRLAGEVASLAIRVVCVEPGNVLVPGGRWEERLTTEPEAVQAMLEQDVLLQRLASPEEVADVICFLASPRASFVTATRVVVDGGQTHD